MTDAERRYYEANKHLPEFKAKRRAAVKRYDETNCLDGLVYPVVGERFDEWLQRWAESEGRTLFAARASRMHKRLQREVEARRRKAAAAIERVRAGKADPVRTRHADGFVQRRLASWRQPGEFLSGADLVTSVFDLGKVKQLHAISAKPATEAAPGAVAQRRDGGSAPMVAEPALALPGRHVGVLDAAAAVRLPQRLIAP